MNLTLFCGGMWGLMAGNGGNYHFAVGLRVDFPSAWADFLSFDESWAGFSLLSGLFKNKDGDIR